MAFMCKFLRENNQDLSEKLKFLDCVDLISTNFDCNEKEGFMGRQRYNPSLMRDTIKFLIPETSSADVQERIMAISRITRLICCIECHCTAKGMKAFKIGKLVGYLILCSNDPSENVCHWAADGLHHLYTLILQRKSMMKFGDSEEFEELLQEWEEEKLFWLAWFSDVSPTTVRFKKSLRADEQLDVILVAIKGMRDDNIYRTKAATQMLKAMLRDPQPIFIKIPKIIKSLYSDLEHISDARARQEVFRFLWMLGKSHPQEVVKTLLGCSIQCDCTASAMWNALTCFSEPAQKVLNVLQSILLEQPLYSDGPGVKATLNPLAATTALYEILRRPSPACREALRAMYPMLSIALLCQISYTVHFTPEEIDIYWSACIRQEIPTPPAPLRSALRAFKGLIRRAGDGDQALIMNRRGGSELLVHRGTHQKGLTVFAR
ncbi:maestro heat-like repeat-containing protein family member 7 [Rhineura floridana]|uniref:maestro heat-like repeat-containing protein family member 7 n=1 Tax=Rhineura floridana TaxID=261503 RepID=UPI002AC877D0|nr:maestro heat-like repeat-containing protein family member 7 [Rhineura floridana]